MMQTQNVFNSEQIGGRIILPVEPST